MGCQADAYILVVCIDNPLSYIKRNISYLESLFNSKVIALAVSPLSNDDRWSTLSSRLELIDGNSQKAFCEKLVETFNIASFPCQNKWDIKKIVELCIGYFS